MQEKSRQGAFLSAAHEWYDDDPDDFRVVLKRPVSETNMEKTRVETRVESMVKSSEKTRVKSRAMNYKKVSRNKGERTKCGKRGNVKSRVKSSVESRVKSSVESVVKKSD